MSECVSEFFAWKCTYLSSGMNARMRRIDLFCKLMGPLTISLVAIASTEIAIYTTLGMNVASVVTEYVFIEQVTAPFPSGVPNIGH